MSCPCPGCRGWAGVPDEGWSGNPRGLRWWLGCGSWSGLERSWCADLVEGRPGVGVLAVFDGFEDAAGVVDGDEVNVVSVVGGGADGSDAGGVGRGGE